jgi:CcmD family protein
MGTFVTGYMLVALAVMGYIARLGRRQRGLQREFETLQSAWQAQEDGSGSKVNEEGCRSCS